MCTTSQRALDQYTDDALMTRYIELSAHADQHAAELAEIDAVIQARLLATYGASDPGSTPRVRYALS